MNNKILLILVLFPILVFAQNFGEADGVNELSQNANFIQQLGLLGPMALNPYLTLLITSIAAKMGFGNSFIATNPIFDSYLIMFIAAVCLVLTILPKLFSKLAAPISMAASYVETKAAILISIIVMVAPHILKLESDLVSTNIVQMSILPVSLKLFFTIGIGVYYLMVVMTVRLFFEFMIYLIPIPFIDLLFETAKNGVSFGMIILAIFFPVLALFINVLFFVVCLFLYRRASRFTDKQFFLLAKPLWFSIFKVGGGLNEILIPDLQIGKSFDLANPVIVENRIGPFSAGSKVILLVDKDVVILAKKRWFRSPKQYGLEFAIKVIELRNLKISFFNSEDKEIFFTNKIYKRDIESISKILNAEVRIATTSEAIKNVGRSLRSKWNGNPQTN